VTVGSAATFHVPVTETASGLFLKLPTSLAVPSALNHLYTAQPFQVRNLGDIGAYVTLSMPTPGVATLALNTTVAPSTSHSITSYVGPFTAGTVLVDDFVINSGTSGSTTVSSSVPLAIPVCWPLPTMSVVVTN